jgi:hypothetical protein
MSKTRFKDCREKLDFAQSKKIGKIWYALWAHKKYENIEIKKIKS